MKKFRFRLEQVLRYRNTIRDERKRELMLKNNALREAREYLDALEQAQRENTLPTEEVRIEEFLMRGLYAERLKEQITNQLLAILECEKEVEEALAAYIEAAKEAKALETLKERRHSEYQEAYLKEQERVLDEVSTQRSSRTSSKLQRKENQV